MNSNAKIAKRTVPAYATALWLACGLVASNAHADEIRSQTVKFADLNIGTPAGAEALYGRIHAAARCVCDYPLAWRAAVSACVTKAESEAIGKVNIPLLTALYQSKTGNSSQELTANR
jgi:UrcA family protein